MVLVLLHLPASATKGATGSLPAMQYTTGLGYHLPWRRFGASPMHHGRWHLQPDGTAPGGLPGSGTPRPCFCIWSTCCWGQLQPMLDSCCWCMGATTHLPPPLNGHQVGVSCQTVPAGSGVAWLASSVRCSMPGNTPGQLMLHGRGGGGGGLQSSGDGQPPVAPAYLVLPFVALNSNLLSRWGQLHPC